MTYLPAFPYAPRMSSPSASVVLPVRISSGSMVVAFNVSPKLSTVSPGRSLSFSESLSVNVRSALVNTSPYVFDFSSAWTMILCALLTALPSTIVLSSYLISSVITSALSTAFTGTHIVTLLYFLLSAGRKVSSNFV